MPTTKGPRSLADLWIYAISQMRLPKSKDKGPRILEVFGIIHTIANDAAQERKGGATEPPFDNEEEGSRSRPVGNEEGPRSRSVGNEKEGPRSPSVSNKTNHKQ